MEYEICLEPSGIRFMADAGQNNGVPEQLVRQWQGVDQTAAGTSSMFTGMKREGAMAS